MNGQNRRKKENWSRGKFQPEKRRETIRIKIDGRIGEKGKILFPNRVMRRGSGGEE